MHHQAVADHARFEDGALARERRRIEREVAVRLVMCDNDHASEPAARRDADIIWPVVSGSSGAGSLVRMASPTMSGRRQMGW
jgi:hypothetical protein